MTVKVFAACRAIMRRASGIDNAGEYGFPVGVAATSFGSALSRSGRARGISRLVAVVVLVQVLGSCAPDSDEPRHELSGFISEESVVEGSELVRTPGELTLGEATLIDPELRAKAARSLLDLPQATVRKGWRFIVDLDSEFFGFDSTPVRRRNGRLRGTIDDARLKARWSQYGVAKARLISDLQIPSEKVLYIYDPSPRLALQASLPELLALMKHPGVERVHADVEMDLLTASSLPFINMPAAHADGYDGSNQVVVVIDGPVRYWNQQFGLCGTSPNSDALVGGPSCAILKWENYAKCQEGASGCVDDPVEIAGMKPTGHGPGGDHGTNVAGIVHAMAPEARIVALNVFHIRDKEDPAKGTEMKANTIDVVAALARVKQLNPGFDIVAVNMSLGATRDDPAYCPDDSYHAEIQDLWANAGILVAVASGNDGHKNSVSAPACIPHAVSVGAVFDTDGEGEGDPGCPNCQCSGDVQQGAVACFSNGQEALDLLAPGFNITAGGIVNMAGTSMAAPHVAGYIAVLQQEAVAQEGASLDPMVVLEDLRLRGLNRTDNNAPSPKYVSRQLRWADGPKVDATYRFCEDYAGTAVGEEGLVLDVDTRDPYFKQPDQQGRVITDMWLDLELDDLGATTVEVTVTAPSGNSSTLTWGGGTNINSILGAQSHPEFKDVFDGEASRGIFTLSVSNPASSSGKLYRAALHLATESGAPGAPYVAVNPLAGDLGTDCIEENGADFPPKTEVTLVFQHVNTGVKSTENTVTTDAFGNFDWTFGLPCGGDGKARAQTYISHEDPNDIGFESIPMKYWGEYWDGGLKKTQPVDYTLSYGGSCDPVKNCEGKVCGTDGCGGYCGMCTGTKYCVQGVCGATGEHVLSVCGSLNGNHDWDKTDSPVLVTCDLDVNGSLTIHPGVIVLLEDDYNKVDLRVKDGATMIAVGTPEEPILFTSQTSVSEGAWGGINIFGAAGEVTIKDAEFRYGGGTDFAVHAPIAVGGATPTIEDISFVNNRTNGIGLKALEYSADVHLSTRGIPYYVEADITINSGVTMTVDPGVIVKFEDSYYSPDLLVYGRLVANGTPAEPIHFTSYREDALVGDTNNDGSTAPKASDWGGIYLAKDESGLLPSELTHVVISYGGETSNGVDFPIKVTGYTQPTVENVTLSHNRIDAIGLVAGEYAADLHVNVVGIPYYVTEDLTVNTGVTMTADPGVIVKFEDDYYAPDLWVYGRLVAIGTLAKPVVFTSYKDDANGGDSNNDGSTAPKASDWGGIYLTKDSTGLQPSSLSHVKVLYGGESVKGVGYPIRVNGVTQPTVQDVTLSHNRIDAIGLISGEYAYDLHLNIVGHPYYVTDDITVNQGVTMTVDPGVVVKFEDDYYTPDLYIMGRLVANGTPFEPIVFTSYRDDARGGDSNADGSTSPQAQDWGGIYLTKDSSGLSPSELRHVIITYAGEDTKGVAYPIYVTGNAVPTVENVMVDNCRINAVGLVTGTYSSDLHLNVVGIPYYVDSDITVNAGVSMTLDAGTTIKFQDDYYTPDLIIDGTLMAKGTPAKRVVFTSYKDDAYGGDSNADGMTSPAPEDWGGIVFGSTSVGSSIINARISYGGEGTKGAGCGVVANSSSPLLESVEFLDNAHGLCIYGSGSPDVGGGMLGSAGGNSFIGHAPGKGSWAVYNDSSETVNAHNNWWGTAQSALIDQIIWDQKDDPTVGLVLYDTYSQCVIGQPCDDGDQCTKYDQCMDGSCSGIAYVCDSPGFCETSVGAICDGQGDCTYGAAIGEQCDDGVLCTHTDHCNADRVCSGTAYLCGDAGPCQAAEGAACDGKGGCVFEPSTGAPCSDGIPCTHSDKCQADYSCLGIQYQCGEPDDCEKVGYCTGDGNCFFGADVDANCDDEDPCTMDDKCLMDKSCVGTPYNCDSPEKCETAENATCDGLGNCVYSSNTGAECDDGNPCTHGDECSPEKACQGIAYVCDDPDDCESALDVSCDGLGGCEYQPNIGAGCKDGSPCTVDDKCAIDKSCVGTLYECGEPGMCEKLGVCNGDGTCNFEPDIGAECDDVDPCTKDDKCLEGKICAGTPYVCDSPGSCQTVGMVVCDGEGGCAYDPAPGAVCDDGNPCTKDDICDGELVCAGEPYECNTPEDCETAEDAECDGEGGCVYLSTPALPCDDGQLCTHSDHCLEDKSCLGVEYECGAPGACKTAVGEACDGVGGCFFQPAIGTSCDDGNPCTMDDNCLADASCLGVAYECDNPSQCESPENAVCTGDGDCDYLPKLTAPCNDGKACTHSDTCQPDKVCVGMPYSCDSPKQCESPGSGICLGDGNCAFSANVGSPCDDGEACTSADQCFPDASCKGEPYTCDSPGPCQTSDGAQCQGDGDCHYDVEGGAACSLESDCVAGPGLCNEAGECLPSEDVAADWTACSPDDGLHYCLAGWCESVVEGDACTQPLVVTAETLPFDVLVGGLHPFHSIPDSPTCGGAAASNGADLFIEFSLTGLEGAALGFQPSTGLDIAVAIYPVFECQASECAAAVGAAGPGEIELVDIPGGGDGTWMLHVVALTLMKPADGDMVTILLLEPDKQPDAVVSAEALEGADDLVGFVDPPIEILPAAEDGFVAPGKAPGANGSSEDGIGCAQVQYPGGYGGLVALLILYVVFWISLRRRRQQEGPAVLNS